MPRTEIPNDGEYNPGDNLMSGGGTVLTTMQMNIIYGLRGNEQNYTKNIGIFYDDKGNQQSYTVIGGMLIIPGQGNKGLKMRKALLESQLHCKES